MTVVDQSGACHGGLPARSRGSSRIRCPRPVIFVAVPGFVRSRGEGRGDQRSDEKGRPGPLGARAGLIFCPSPQVSEGLPMPPHTAGGLRGNARCLWCNDVVMDPASCVIVVPRPCPITTAPPDFRPGLVFLAGARRVASPGSPSRTNRVRFWRCQKMFKTSTGNCSPPPSTAVIFSSWRVSLARKRRSSRDRNLCCRHSAKGPGARGC
jgi:hypothetical protein